MGKINKLKTHNFYLAGHFGQLLEILWHVSDFERALHIYDLKTHM